MTSPPTTRHPLSWPFAADSIWNQPIGSEARYVDAAIQPAANLQVDEDHFYQLSNGDPLQPLFSIGNWENGRATGTIYQNIALPLPDNFAIADARPGQTPNNAAAFLLPDGRTLVQVNALTRPAPPSTSPEATGPGQLVYGWRSVNQDILGPGRLGGHAGSGLSSIGGTLRPGELIGPEPIRHALKINLWAERYFSYSVGTEGGLGYRWPADRADNYATPATYGGGNPALLLGSLLAIPPAVTPEQLGLKTEAARKLFYAFQDYGAYVADDTAWNAHALTLEVGVKEEFETHYGYGFEASSGPFYDDVMALFSALAVVDNNGPERIGGGGEPRAPMAPPFDAAAVAELASPSLVATATDGPLYGGPQGDFLYGTEADDILYGEGGNDYLDGVAGNNHLVGGSGDDLLVARPGRHYYEGGPDIDTLLVTADTTLILSDTTLGGPATAGRSPRPELAADLEIGPRQIGLSPFANSTLSAIEKALLVGGNGDNWLDAGGFSGAVQADGGLGHDWLIGGAGPSVLRGGTGSDGLVGGDSDDVLQGSNELQRQGIDWLWGGMGQDRFILAQGGEHHYLDNNSLGESSDSSADAITGPQGRANYAIIADLDPAQDNIQLIDTAAVYRLVPTAPPELDSQRLAGRTAVSLYWIGEGGQGPDLLAVLLGSPDLLQLTLQSQVFVYDASG